MIANTWARMALLIETCKPNAVAPYAYLGETPIAIANGPRRHASAISCPGRSKDRQAESPTGVTHRLRRSDLLAKVSRWT